MESNTSNNNINPDKTEFDSSKGSRIVFLVSKSSLTEATIANVLAKGALPNMKAVARKSKIKSLYITDKAEYECTCVILEDNYKGQYKTVLDVDIIPVEAADCYSLLALLNKDNDIGAAFDILDGKGGDLVKVAEHVLNVAADSIIQQRYYLEKGKQDPNMTKIAKMVLMGAINYLPALAKAVENDPQLEAELALKTVECVVALTVSCRSMAKTIRACNDVAKAFREKVLPQSRNALILYKTLKRKLTSLRIRISKVLKKTLDRQEWLAEMDTILACLDSAVKQAGLTAGELQKISMLLDKHLEVSKQSTKASRDSAIGHFASIGFDAFVAIMTKKPELLFAQLVKIGIQGAAFATDLVCYIKMGSLSKQAEQHVVLSKKAAESSRRIWQSLNQNQGELKESKAHSMEYQQEVLGGIKEQLEEDVVEMETLIVEWNAVLEQTKSG